MARKPTGKPNGRPKINWTEDQKREFVKLCEIHCTIREICGWFEIDEVTLEKILKKEYGDTFSKVFERFASKGKISLRRQIFQAAFNKENPDFRAMKWLSTQHLGMTDKVEQKVQTSGEVTIKIGWADEDQHSDAKKDTTPKKV